MVESMALPIISKEDWNLAQEKHSKNNYRREKIHNPEHAHILSGILNSYRLMWTAYMALWKRLMNYMRKGKGD